MKNNFYGIILFKTIILIELIKKNFKRFFIYFNNILYKKSILLNGY